jgi:AbrB family looped-hinge helix DNA binding protein
MCFMSTVTVSDKGQVVIPAAIRRRLGIAPGSRLDFELEGDSIRVRLLKSIPRSQAEDGYGMLRCELPGERRLADFDVAAAMREAVEDSGDDRP